MTHHTEYQFLMSTILFVGAVCCPGHKKSMGVMLYIAAAVWLFRAIDSSL